MSTTEENKALVRRYWEEFFNKRNLAVIDELIAPNYVSHDSGGSESLGREAARQVATSTFGGFPDFHATVKDQVAEGDKVVTRGFARMTQRGEFMGIPPTGKDVTFTWVAIDRIEGGKIVEAWSEGDGLGLLRQLGAIPTPG